MKRRNFLKAIGASALAAPALVSTSRSTAASGPEPDNNLTITWLGAATMLIACGELTILTDPAFGDGDKAFQMGDPNEMFDLEKGPEPRDHVRHTQFGGVDLSQVDHVLLSHMHEDHFDQTAERLIRKDMPVFVPRFDEARIAGKGFTQSTTAVPGRSFTLVKGATTLTVTPVPADHSENEKIAAVLGEGNGYWMEFRRGSWSKTIYWSGDTFATPKVLTALSPFPSPDIFIPHMGGVGATGPLGQITMGANHVADFVATLNPEKILPVHHSTYELYLEPVSALAVKLEGRHQGLDLISETSTLTYS